MRAEDTSALRDNPIRPRDHPTPARNTALPQVALDCPVRMPVRRTCGTPPRRQRMIAIPNFTRVLNLPPRKRAMDRGPGPITHPVDQPRLHWRTVDHMPMRSHIVRIANPVLPETALPNPLFPRTQTLTGAWNRCRHRPGKQRLQHPPPQRKLRIACGQGPDGVNNAGQNHDVVNNKRHPVPRLARHLAQHINFTYQKVRGPVGQSHREKVCSIGTRRSCVSGHGPI